LEDGDTSPLVQILSERGVAVVITTGYAVRPGIEFLQKPYAERDLINALTKCAAAVPLTPAIK
jgi:hypothetical protein